MRVLDLFSGIGGFSLGLERAGMETVAFCEYDKKAQLVLKKHWPEIPIYDDIRQLTGKQIAKDIGTIDLICGGFPCQPFSVAGKQRGEEDDRHLWPEMFRLIQEIRPRWVIGENVAGLINMGLDQVLSDLESANYSCQTFVIPACALDAPHRRDRVWIVGNAKEMHVNGGGDKRETSRPQIPELRNTGSTNNVAHSKRQRPPRSGEHKRSGDSTQDINRKTSGADNGSERGKGCWLPEPELGRVAHGIPNRVDRLKQLGNAVVPQIVEVIGRTIMEIDKLPLDRQSGEVRGL